jgi:hypothetical protein
LAHLLTRLVFPSRKRSRYRGVDGCLRDFNFNFGDGPLCARSAKLLGVGRISGFAKCAYPRDCSVPPPNRNQGRARTVSTFTGFSLSQVVNCNLSNIHNRMGAATRWTRRVIGHAEGARRASRLSLVGVTSFERGENPSRRPPPLRFVMCSAARLLCRCGLMFFGQLDSFRKTGGDPTGRPVRFAKIGTGLVLSTSIRLSQADSRIGNARGCSPGPDKPRLWGFVSQKLHAQWNQ